LKVAVVILNFNGKSHLEEFLPSVISNTPDWAEIIVADNASTDESIAFMESAFPDIRLIKMTENRGFAGGYNKALKGLAHPFYVLLNSDVEVSKNWLEPLISSMESQEGIGAAQPRILDYNKKDHFEYAGAAGGFIDQYWFPFCRGRLFDNCERDIGQHNDPREVFWASGACLVVKSAVYWEVEGLDEDLFAHMEEIDLCWRMKNRGYQVYCFPQSKVFHLGGGTLAAVNPRKTYLNFRNNLLIAVKNDYRPKLFGRFVKRLLLDGIAAFHFLFTKGFGHFWAVLHAHFSFYLSLSKFLKKRKFLKQNANKTNRTGLFRTSIVKAYYMKKKRVFGALPSRQFIRQNREK
jgi:GT2 family glycosyltransferase